MYKIDTHIHTKEISSCAKVPASELVQLYSHAGYNGLVITDHFYKGFFESLEALNWEEKINTYMSGYETALSRGEALGLDIFFGMEIRFIENANDYLVFGINKDFLLEHENLYELGLSSFKSLIKKENALIYQAHPYRQGIVPAPPELLDGVEIYNGNPRHDSKNHLANDFAKINSLRTLSGSDFHQLEDIARGGILLNRRPENMDVLVNMLKNNEVLELIRT